MGVISKLDAVNHMLLMAGESMVSDLENNSGLDTETAQFCLDQFIRDFQMRGMANNRYIKKYNLSSKGTIDLAITTLSAELVSHHANDENYNIIGIAKGTANKYLWNVTDQTDQWDANTDYRVELILEINWEDMDTPVQRAILSSAARQYQLVTQGDGDADNYLGSLEGLYMAKGKAADLDDKRRNILLNGSRSMRDALNRHGPIHDATVLRNWRTWNG